MQQNYRKMKRVKPLLRIRQSKVTEEMSKLNEIRAEKQKVVREMRESQHKYMKGVEDLNRVRSSTDRSNLETLEEALDAVKVHWYQLFKKVQQVEALEKSQVEELLSAEKNLKSVENLQEKYTEQFQKDLLKGEQKALDEVALRRHGVRS
jgi:flagellar export protein FliJ